MANPPQSLHLQYVICTPAQRADKHSSGQAPTSQGRVGDDL